MPLFLLKLRRSPNLVQLRLDLRLKNLNQLPIRLHQCPPIKDSHHLACGSAIYLMRLPRLVARDAADSGIFIEVAVEGKGMRDAKSLYDGEACAVNKAE